MSVQGFGGTVVAGGGRLSVGSAPGPASDTVAGLEAENVCLLAVAETALSHLYVLAASVEACGHVCGRPGWCGVCAAVAYVEGRRP